MKNLNFIAYCLLVLGCNYETRINDISINEKPLDSLINEDIGNDSISNKNVFINFLDEGEVVRIINDTLKFSFDFDLHGYDCGAPDCYSTLIDFSIPFSDSIIFPKTLNINEQTIGECFENVAPKNYIFILAENSDNYLIYNSRGARKSLVIDISKDEYNEKVYYFSEINYPITLKNVDRLLIFDENTKQSEMPFRSTNLAYKL